jgi:voltage-gated potassium channel
VKILHDHIVYQLRRGNRRWRPFGPFLGYLFVVLVFVIVYGWLFLFLMEAEGRHSTFLTGVYWALTVMSTLGIGDITLDSDVGHVFTIAVLLTGVVLFLIILPFLFIRTVYAPWVEERAQRQRRVLQRLPDDLSDHVVICVRDPIGVGLADRLRLAGVPSVIIEPDAEEAEQMHATGLPVLHGAIDEEDTYRAARVNQARLVYVNSTDPTNTTVILTVRDLAPSVPIAANTESPTSIGVMEFAGATFTLPVKHRLGEHLAERVRAGHARANIIGGIENVVLAELPIHNTPLEGKRVTEATILQDLNVTIVGVWDAGQLLPAHDDQILGSMQVPVLIASKEQVAALNELLVIYDANPNPVVVIGGGQVGRAATLALKARDIPVHLVEKDGSRAAALEGIADRLFIGDASRVELMEDAGVQDAPSILLTTSDDFINVYLSVYCRRRNPGARILTRVTHERNVGIVSRTGADFVLSYASFGVQNVYSFVKGSALTMFGEGVDLYHVPVSDSLEGKSLGDIDVASLSGLNVIAIQNADGIVVRGLAKVRLEPGTTLVAFGSAEQRERFAEVFGS